MKPVRDLANKEDEDVEILPRVAEKAPTGIVQKGGRVVPVGSPGDSTGGTFFPGDQTGIPPTSPTVNQRNKNGSGGQSTHSRRR